MYTLSGSEQIEEVSDIPQPDAGTPEPSLTCDEHNLILEYYSAPRRVDENDKKVKIIVEGATIHMFGFPNDEVLGGHPLTKVGLDYYSVAEVKNSGWIDELEKLNSIHPRHDKERFMADKHHYVITFHDSTFECIAKSIELS